MRQLPMTTNALGPFLTVYYFPRGVPDADVLCLEGTALTAKDGRLICAESYDCTFHERYFDVATTDDSRLHARLLQERVKANFQAER
jgi:hypothetical protein